MKILQADQKTFLKFNNLSRPDILHFTSTRQGWGQDGKSRFTGDRPEMYLPFRQELALSLKVGLDHLVFPRQVHGQRVVVVNKPILQADIPETDALMTNQPGLCICVQTADCVPVLLFDPVQRVIAAIHAGWRGTVGKIVAETIHSMQRHFRSSPENILAGIGPSIHLHAYEVGEEVIDAVRGRFANHRALLKPANDPHKAFFDLWEANRTVMTEAGVPGKNIELMGYCSFSHEPLFFSARREGAQTGRMVSGIMLR